MPERKDDDVFLSSFENLLMEYIYAIYPYYTCVDELQSLLCFARTSNEPGNTDIVGEVKLNFRVA